MGAKSSRAMYDILGSSSDEMDDSFEVSSTTIDLKNKRQKTRSSAAARSTRGNLASEPGQPPRRSSGVPGKLSITRGKFAKGLPRKFHSFARGEEARLMLKQRIKSSTTNDGAMSLLLNNSDSSGGIELKKNRNPSLSDMTFVVFDDDDSLSPEEPSSSTQILEKISHTENGNKELILDVPHASNPGEIVIRANKSINNEENDHQIQKYQKCGIDSSRIASKGCKNLRKTLTKSGPTAKNKKLTEKPSPKVRTKRSGSKSKKCVSSEEKSVKVVAKAKASNSGPKLRKRKRESDAESQNNQSTTRREEKRNRIVTKKNQKNLNATVGHVQVENGASVKNQPTGARLRRKRQEPNKSVLRKRRSDGDQDVNAESANQRQLQVTDTRDVGCFPWFGKGSISNSPPLKKKKVHISVPESFKRAKHPKRTESPRSPQRLRKSSRKIKPSKRMG